jgi:hypothetical protein
MANNRLYLCDPTTGRTFMLARSMGSSWMVNFSHRELQSWLSSVGGSTGKVLDWQALEDDDEPTQLYLFDDHMSEASQVREHINATSRAAVAAHERMIASLSKWPVDDADAAAELSQSEQETARLSTEHASSEPTCACDLQRIDEHAREHDLHSPGCPRDVAPRSGAVQPEETSGGPQRRGT